MRVFNRELNKIAVEADKLPMEKYMKNNFEFYGVRSPIRKNVFKQVMKEYEIPTAQEYKFVVLKMMQHTKREMNYCGIDLAIKCQKKYSNIIDLDYISTLIVTRSWWDSVDTIAPKLLGNYLLNYPEMTSKVLKEYKASSNIWLYRSCVLFQLKYKDKTDADLLFEICTHFKDSKEFFVQKAIGWALREYAKTDADATYRFVDNTNLAPLSKKEAYKHRK